MGTVFAKQLQIRRVNLVGYAQSNLRWGVNLATAQFGSIATDAFKLEDFKPTGDDVSDNITIDIFDEYGAPVNSYTWIEWGSVGDGKYWTEDFENPAEGVTFVPGQAFSVTASDASQGLQSAGEVEQGDITFQLRWGVSLGGNPYPVAVNLQDIVPSGDDLSDNITIDIFDEYGAPVNSYTWIEWGSVGEGKYWTEDFENPAEGVSLIPGQGLSITGSSDAQFVTFPAPEL